MATVEDLAELVADVRAVLEYNGSRGMRVEPVPTEGELRPATSVPSATGSPSLEVQAARTASVVTAPAADRMLDTSMADVRADLGDCQRCGLCASRRSVVFGVGSTSADLMIIAEGPREQEDAVGQPFVGPAGDMLNKMLQHVIGLARDQVYITGIVKCRAPGDRNPLPAEMAACMPFLHRQIRVVQPKVILVLGSVALSSLLDVQGITRARGRWLDLDGIPVMPTFHPAYLLRRPTGKRDTFNDLKAVRERYDQVGGTR